MLALICSVSNAKKLTWDLCSVEKPHNEIKGWIKGMFEICSGIRYSKDAFGRDKERLNSPSFWAFAKDLTEMSVFHDLYSFCKQKYN